MKPYYEHAGIMIYRMDTRDLLPRMLCNVDALITDPHWSRQRRSQCG